MTGESEKSKISNVADGAAAADDPGHDVDKLRAALREARGRADLLQSVLENVSDAVYATDEEGRFIVANEPAMEFVRGELPDADLPDRVEQRGLFHADKVTPVRPGERPLQRALRGETVEDMQIFEINERRPEGTFFSVSSKPLPLGPDGRVGLVVTFRDISGLKRTETRLTDALDELKNQTEIMEATFNSMGEGIVVANGEGEFLYVNPAAERMVGMGPVEAPVDEWAELYGTFYTDRKTPVKSEDLPLIRAAVHGEHVDDEDLFIRNPNRPEGINIRVSARPLLDGAGEIRAAVVVFRDVTQEMVATRALTEAFAHGRLEILDTVLHNIGNAINSVTVGLESLHGIHSDSVLVQRLGNLADAVEAHRDNWTEYIRDDPQGQQVLPFIVALAGDFRRRNAMLTRTLDRVRDRAKHVEDIVLEQKTLGSPLGNRKVVVLRDTISSAVNVLEHTIGKRSIRVDIDCKGAPREIRVQESRWNEVLVNLIKNAAEAIDDRMAAGTLDDAPTIRIVAYAGGEFLYLDVTDNGIGIDSKNTRAIFNAGFTTKKKGSGLGLHSTANFVIGGGGRIRAISEGIGKGATMRVMLRLSSILPPPPPPPPENGPNKR